MRVLVFAKMQGNSAMSSIRTMWPVRELNKINGFQCSYVSVKQLQQMIQQGTTEQLDDFDLYVLSRLHAPTEAGKPPFEKQRAKGAKFIYETDDDLTGQYRDYGVADWVRETVVFCDAVTVSTPHLKKMMKRYEKPVYVLPNHIDTEFYGSVSMDATRQTDRLTIGLVGTATHWPDWIEVAEPLKRIKKEYPHVRICCVCYRPEYLRDVTDLFFSGLPFNVYPALLRQIDIRLCPLDSSDGFNNSKCVTGATLISTDGGLVPIRELGAGDRIYAKAECRIAKGHFKYIERDIVSIETKLGYSISGTPKHRVMTPDGWTRLDCFAEGDKVTLTPTVFSGEYQVVPFNCWSAMGNAGDMPIKTVSCPRITIDENYGLLIGAILGDGNVTRGAVGITCDEQDLDWAEELVETAAKIGLHAQVKGVSGSRKCVNVRICSVKFSQFLGHIGVWGGAWGRTGGHSKPKNFWIPAMILRSPRSVVAAFLKGLFESDGCVIGCGAGFCTKSERLAREVQIVLLGFGITSKLSRRHNKAYSRYYWYLNLRRAEFDVFASKIGFVSARKVQQSKVVVSRQHSNAYRPMALWDTVASIGNGTADVYDLEVPVEHCYRANGFLSHNSSIAALEAMAAARPLGKREGGAVPICSGGRIKVFNDVIRHGVNGLMVRDGNWYEAIKSVLDDASYRRRLAINGLRWVRRHRDIKNGAHLWGKVYQEVLNG